MTIELILSQRIRIRRFNVHGSDRDAVLGKADAKLALSRRSRAIDTVEAFARKGRIQFVDVVHVDHAAFRTSETESIDGIQGIVNGKSLCVLRVSRKRRVK